MDEQKIRAYWLDFANRYCNQTFNKDNLPLVVELFIDGKIKAYRDNPNVKSEALSDMAVTYFDKELSKEEANLLGQVRKLKVVK